MDIFLKLDDLCPRFEEKLLYINHVSVFFFSLKIFSDIEIKQVVNFVRVCLGGGELSINDNFLYTKLFGYFFECGKNIVFTTMDIILD